MNHPSTGDIAEAKKLLEQAISLHERHMNGTEPTTGPAGGASQMKMMNMMQKALTALQGGPINKLVGGILSHRM